MQRPLSRGGAQERPDLHSLLTWGHSHTLQHHQVLNSLAQRLGGGFMQHLLKEVLLPWDAHSPEIKQCSYLLQSALSTKTSPPQVTPDKEEGPVSVAS